MAETDISSKKLIGLYPNGWVKWVTQKSEIVVRAMLDSDFQWLSRESDSLIKAYNPELGEFIALNEIQFRPDSRMPTRIRAYAALAEEKYDLLVYPVVINVFPPLSDVTIPTCYQSTIMGLEARQDYRVINLWEIDVEVAFQPELKALLPLAPVMKGGGNETILRRAAQRLQAEERGEDLQQVLGIFATFVLGKELVERVMSLEAQALRESVWGQEILQEGREEGEVRLLQLPIRSRFGEVPESIERNLQQLNLEQIENFAERLMYLNSLDELIAAFSQVSKD